MSIMTDLREKFKHWLNERRLSEKTNSDRSGTIYEYIRRLDALSHKLYNQKNKLSDWELLAKNIDSVLIPYSECSNKEYYLDWANIDSFIGYLDSILKNCKYSSYPQTNISLVVNQIEFSLLSSNFCDLEKHIRQISNIFNMMDNGNSYDMDTLCGLLRMHELVDVSIFEKNKIVSQNTITLDNLFFYIQYQQKQNNEYKTALDNFYQFLLEGNDTYLAYLKKERDDDKISHTLAKIESAQANLMKCTTVIPKTGSNALKIKSHDTDGIISISEAYSVLEIDYKTLKNLEKNNILLPSFSDGSYSETVINAYLDDHFHKVTPPYAGVDYSLIKDQWCNRREAAERMNCTERTIYNYTKKGLLTYTDYAPQAPRYYRPELDFLKKSEI